MIALVIVGCAPSRSPFDASLRPPTPRPLGSDIADIGRRLDDRDAAIEQREAIALTGTISLRDAVAAALAGNPELAAAAYAARAAEDDVLQAGVYPNPEFEAEVENFGGEGELEGFDAAETTLALSQLIELGGKRVKRRAVAGSAATLAAWDYEFTRIDVFTRTAADFIDLLAAERTLAIAEETTELANKVFSAIGERVEAGKVSPVERTKARIELAQARLVRERAASAVAAARVRLAANWGSARPSFTDAQGDLAEALPPPDLDSLVVLVEQNPDLARWASEAALRQAEIELALAQRVPDVTIAGGVRYASDADDYAFVAGLSLPLPIFDRNEGAIRAARLRGLQGAELEHAARVRILTALAIAHQALQSAYTETRLIESDILPSSQAAFEAAEEAFRQGKLDALNLIDAERTFFLARQQHIDALAEYQRAILVIERLIGAPLSDARDADPESRTGDEQ